MTTSVRVFALTPRKAEDNKDLIGTPHFLLNMSNDLRLGYSIFHTLVELSVRVDNFCGLWVWIAETLIARSLVGKCLLRIHRETFILICYKENDIL